MATTIFIVECHSGEFEDSVTYINSVWFTKPEADAAQLKVTDQIEAVKNIPNPVYGDDEPIDPMTMNDEDFEKHQAWQVLINKANDFRGAFINEYTIGEYYNLLTQE